jgi:hypothetical protein
LIEQAIPKLSRGDLEGLTERLIDRLDEIDGDADLEPTGDEDDMSEAEDDHGLGNHSVPRWTGPGCPISDPDMGAEDYAFDPDEDMCAAGDDGCGPVLVHGRVYWGAPNQ